MALPRLDRAGKVLRMDVGRVGTIPTTFAEVERPVGLAVGLDRSLYVTSYTTHSVGASGRG